MITRTHPVHSKKMLKDGQSIHAHGRESLGPYQPPLIVSKIAQAIDDRGMSRVFVEKEAGLAKFRIYNWLKRSGQPDIHQAINISKVVDIPLSYLADDTVPVSSPPPRDDRSDSDPLRELIRGMGLDSVEVMGYMGVVAVAVANQIDPNEAIRQLTKPSTNEKPTLISSHQTVRDMVDVGEKKTKSGTK